MTHELFAFLIVALPSLSSAGDLGSSPLSKVISLMGDLAVKVEHEGEQDGKAFAEYTEWCKDVARTKAFDIQTGTAQQKKLDASIFDFTASITAADSKIESLAADIAVGSADLKSAAAIRVREATDFSASETELTEAIDMLSRAQTILQREMAKNPAALSQVDGSSTEGIVQALHAVVDAASFSATDKQRLLNLVQSQQASDDDDSEFGAPTSAVYKTKSGSILDVLADMQDKAETQSSELRKAEVNAKYNYDLLKQSLENQLSADKQDMEDEKTGKAEASESKAVAEGDLAVTLADLKSATETLETARAGCLNVATDHEQTMKAREEELKVIAEATAILKATTSGARDHTYSLLQAGSAILSHADLVHSEVVNLVKKLARVNHSAALAQLASRIAAVVRYGSSSGEDPFAKVKVLLENMIAKLTGESVSEASEKQYCDDQMMKTEQKKNELEKEQTKLTSRIDRASARSTQLKSEVQELLAQLATMASEQAENNKWRQSAHADYVQAKSDLELGMTGVRKALTVLREYYGAAAALLQQPAPPMPKQHSAAGGAGQSIIGILEVVESDFASDLSKIESEESESQDAYEKDTQEFKVSKAKKDADVSYKRQESTSLDKSIADLSSDHETADTELSAILEYYDKLKERCVAKPEAYETRRKRREAEVAGLKEALSILESETAFVQHRGARRGGRHMRGAVLLAFSSH
jgi:hypothetical protein